MAAPTFAPNSRPYADLYPRLTPSAEFEVNLALALRCAPSELDSRLTSRDWALLVAWWEKHGGFEPLVVEKDA